MVTAVGIHIQSWVSACVDTKWTAQNILGQKNVPFAAF
jgi:hypothetical protein